MPTPAQGYRLKDGTRVPGVTTILGRWKESGGLLQWAFKQGQSGARSLYEERDKAADIGTLAHAMVENRLTGIDPECALVGAPEEFKPKAKTAYRSFDTWAANLRADLILVSAEQPLVSEAHRFGGTPDFVIRLPDGRLALGDVKTSNGIYRDMLLQVAAYKIVWDETHPDDPITGGFHIARFAKEFPDFEHRYFEDLTEAGELFLLLRKAYEMDLTLKKRAA
jgi:hypothetical protein